MTGCHHVMTTTGPLCRLPPVGNNRAKSVSVWAVRNNEIRLPGGWWARLGISHLRRQSTEDNARLLRRKPAPDLLFAHFGFSLLSHRYSEISPLGATLCFPMAPLRGWAAATDQPVVELTR